MKLTDEQIRDELRALRETPSEEFSAQLDAWAEHGFPASSAPHRRQREDPRTPRAGRALVGRLAHAYRRLQARPALGALAGAASLVLVAGVALSVYTLSEPEGPGDGSDAISGIAADGTEPAGEDALRQSAPSGDQPAPGALPPAPPQEQLRPGQPRVQERSAAMTLSTDSDEVAEVADTVIEVTERHDGIVVSSNVSTTEDVGRASFDLRIPTANLQATLADLSDLASVASRQEGTLDITAPFVTAEERFQDAKAEVDSLLERLADADSEGEAASIREQLRAARAELASARSQLGALKQRADFSRLDLTVLGAGDADGWSLGDALDDATNVLEALAGATLVALAVILPLGGLILIGWFGLSRLRRHQRESALDE